ncbi:hypothetical protein Cabys_486 [Caldithrix abyssi DSM 13497]|uniref:Uncharacterized protein n=1 Tax=Caldithrix abyssi DSM 13497 TaxID=880073 RepID=A0A1J1C3G8_CALAY|nr:hypothetical protein Cabys_486 [Caldithrix abyssi DSM 13497]
MEAQSIDLHPVLIESLRLSETCCLNFVQFDLTVSINP